MPVNTIQIQKLLGKHTFQQLRITVNELIDVVNGLPSTVRGDITRQGGVIDGQATGVIPAHDPGNLLITGSGGMGIGNFLGTDDPNLTGQLHINRATGDARLNLSQNTATGITYISLQASNTATEPQANNFGFLAATSNTTSQYGMVVLSTANTDQEVSHIFVRESWAWGNIADVDSSTRFTLTSGENVGLAPHGGPTAHLAAQLRVDRALANDGQTTNTAPIISARGYSASHGGLGNNQVPVRITIGDRNADEATTANTYAALDFLADGADTTTENSIGARIGAEYTREERTTSALEFSVRNGVSPGTLEKVMKILPGGNITGNDSKAAVMISNTYFLDAATNRSLNMGGVSLYANAEFGQLIVQQTAQGAFPRQGILVRGNDDAGSGPTTGAARLAMENPTARYDAGRKWDFRAEDTSADPPSSKFEINTYPDGDWTATPNTQFSIQVSDATTAFNFGNRIGESGGGGASAGVAFNLDGGYDATGEGAQINMDTNRAYQQQSVNRHPTTWAIDNKNAGLRIFPRNLNGFSDTTGSAVTSADSAFWWTKGSTSNTMIGLGVPPSHSLHIQRNWESANVVVESTFSATSPRDESTARILATGQASDFTVIQAVNPDRTYSSATTQGTQHEAGVNIVASKTGSGRADTTLRTIYSSAHDNDGNENQISIRTHSTGGPGNNLGWNIDAVTLIGETGYASGGTQPHLGVPLADRAEYATFGINLRRGQAPGSDIYRALTLTSEGYLAVGRRDDSTGVPAGNRVLQSPGFNLDLSGYRGLASTTANTLIAFSSERGTDTAWSSWTMGIDQSYTGIAKTDNPFVLSGRVSRGLTQQRGVINNLGAAQDGMFVVESRDDAKDRIQVYQIGVREEHNTLTVYTPANNASSPNWDGSYAGRVGIGNTFPAHTLTVNGYNADSSGIAVYGARAAIRFIDTEPSHPSYTWAASSDISGALKDPGGDSGGSVVPERTYHIGSRNGSLVVAQQLGPNDTDIHDSAKAATLSVHANTGVSSVDAPASARADNRINFTPGIGEDHLQNGSVGINANNVPLASGLFVGDYSKASENRRFIFEEKAYFPLNTGVRWSTLEGSYPTLSVLSGRPLSQANGAFKTVSVTAALTSNNADASGTFEAGTGEIMKRIEGVRRFSEGYIPGAATPNPTTSRADANTVAWFDGIGVDDKFSVPMPSIGSEFIGTEASDTTPGTADPQNLATQSAKVWWERRAHQDNEGEGTDYQNREFSESHLFGSSNNHVMTIHANTSYQGVHVEKGGIYANNSILAWARILPRGINQNPLVTEDTSETGTYTAACNEFHNFDGFTHIHRGLYQLDLPLTFQNSNNYAVIVTGTNNLHLSTAYNASGDISVDFGGGFSDVEYRSRTFRKQQAESEHLLGDTRGATDLGTNVYPGGQQQYTVRVANSSMIQIESRVQIYYSNWHGVTTRHDDDEVFVVVVGAPDVTKFRG